MYNGGNQTTATTTVNEHENADPHAWLMFFACGKPDDDTYNYYESTLLEYDVQGYIIAQEIAKESHKRWDGGHYHFMVQMSDEDYHKFTKRIKEKYKLNGRAKNGVSREYGKVNKIEKLERAKAYTVKDGNYRTNLAKETIQKIYEESHEKEEIKTQAEELARLVCVEIENKRTWYDDRSHSMQPILETDHWMDWIGYWRKLCIELAFRMGVKKISKRLISDALHIYTTSDDEYIAEYRKLYCASKIETVYAMLYY